MAFVSEIMNRQIVLPVSLVWTNLALIHNALARLLVNQHMTSEVILDLGVERTGRTFIYLSDIAMLLLFPMPCQMLGQVTSLVGGVGAFRA